MCIKSLRHKKRSATDIHTHAENIMQMQCVSKVCDASDGAPQTYTCRSHHANAMCIKSLRHKQRCATDRHMQKTSCKYNVYQKSATQATVRHRQTHAETVCKYNVYQKSATQATERHRQTHVDNIMQIQCVSEVCDAFQKLSPKVCASMPSQISPILTSASYVKLNLIS